MNIKNLNIASIVIYAVLVIVVLLASYAEFRDDRCTEFGSKQCGPGLGSAYADGRPEKGDSVNDLLKKARITARYEVNSIVWRRCFIAAVISSFLVLYVSKKKIPNGLLLGACFLIVYIIFYLMTTAFQGVVSRPALAQMDKILEQLKRKDSESDNSR
jgi:hypothetical protein